MLQYKPSLTSVLNTPAIYQLFHVLITEKQWKMGSDWLVRDAQWDANRNGRNVCSIAAEAVDGSGSVCNLCHSALEICTSNEDDLFRQTI